uniref:OB domain-containing protein n=1 Tax=Panagrellus redivivus TaxID=6233 RepID=A0A7E4US42_PANRE
MNNGAPNGPGSRDPFTKINELKLNMKNINLHVIVLELGAIRRTMSTNEVRTVTIGDYTGIINMSVWNEYCHLVKPMDVIKIRGAVVTPHKQSLTLSMAKAGDITKVGEYVLAVNDTINLSQEGFLPPDVWAQVQIDEDARKKSYANRGGD